MDRVEEAGRKARAERVGEMILLGFDDQAALAEGRVAALRSEARVAWALGATARLREAMEAVDAAWMRLIDEEDDEDRLEERLADRLAAGGFGGAGTCAPKDEGVARVAAAEMALDAVRGEIDAVIERDCFPRHLYFAAV